MLSPLPASSNSKRSAHATLSHSLTVHKQSWEGQNPTRKTHQKPSLLVTEAYKPDSEKSEIKKIQLLTPRLVAR